MCSSPCLFRVRPVPAGAVAASASSPAAAAAPPVRPLLRQRAESAASAGNLSAIDAYVRRREEGMRRSPAA
eukprot:gene2048-20899_t